jgi:hypothetical protein
MAARNAINLQLVLIELSVNSVRRPTRDEKIFIFALEHNLPSNFRAVIESTKMLICGHLAGKKRRIHAQNVEGCQSE